MRLHNYANNNTKWLFETIEFKMATASLKRSIQITLADSEAFISLNGSVKFNSVLKSVLTIVHFH